MKRQLYNQGGIMSVPRKKFGLGSDLKKGLRKLIPNEVAEVGQKIAPIVGYLNPALGATIQGVSTFDKTGSMSDSLKRAGIQYLATQGARKLAGGDFQSLPGTDDFSFTELSNPASGKSFYDLASPKDFSAFEAPTSLDDFIGEDSILRAVDDKGDNKILKKVKDFVLGGEGKSINITDIAKVAIMAKSYKLSKEDQERLNRLADEAYEKFTREQEQFRRQYSGDAPLDRIEQVNTNSSVVKRPTAMKGGIMNTRKSFMMGSEVPLRKNEGGITEMDFRETGGFVPPIGIKEKADDIPAMLSNNEFVFTADAVRAAGGGSVNKGAQKMYALMKQLEGQA